MRGYPKFNFPAFFAAAETLENQGHRVFNPARADLKEYGVRIMSSETGNLEDISTTGFDLRKALAKDMTWICSEAEAIAMLPGWRRSKGALAEYYLARALGLEVILL